MICKICNKEFELKNENKYLAFKQDLSTIFNKRFRSLYENL